MKLLQIFAIFLSILIAVVTCNYYGSPQFTKVGDKEYFLESHTKQNWFAATNSCLRMNAQLATINNSTEMSEMNDWLLSQGFNEGDWIWIDGLGMRGNYLSFAQRGPMPYAKWWGNQPNGNAANCLMLIRRKSEYYMHDWACTRLSMFICEQ